mgnify:CR=1 FL=1
MVYGYARVSTKGQAREGNSLEDQEIKLREAGATEIYVESFTGTTMDRPELDKLVAKLKPGDTLIVTKLDRIARTSDDGAKFVKKLLNNGIVVNILNMGLIDNTPVGRIILTIFMAFAEFERDMIVERMQAGKMIARQNPNYKEGRPVKYSKKQIEHALSLLESNTYRGVEELTGISKSTLIRAKRKQQCVSE